MNKHTRWLESESSRWVRESIVTAEQAARIRALYAEAAGPPWGLLVFGGLGAAVLGLGVILLLAHNWESIPRAVKLALILGSVAAAHAGAWRLRGLDGWRPLAGEAVAVLGTMLFGAGIWLVAQVYNIDEHYPNGFLFWGLGALAMAWAMDSVPQGLVAVAVLTVWGGTEIFDFQTGLDGAWLLVAAGVGGLAWRRRSPVLAAAVLAALNVLLLGNAGLWWDESGVYFAALSFAVLLLALRHLGPAGVRDGPVGAVLGFFGFTGFLVCAFIMTFKGAAEEILRGRLDAEATAAAVFHRWVLPGGAAAAWLVLVWRRLSRRADGVPLEEWLCPIALFYSAGLSLTAIWGLGEVAAWAFNLIVLGVAAAWMVRGCRDGRLRETVIGSLVLAVLVFARYFDLFSSLAARGAAFLVLGAILFGQGFYYRRFRRATATAEGGGQ